VEHGPQLQVIDEERIVGGIPDDAGQHLRAFDWYLPLRETMRPDVIAGQPADGQCSECADASRSRGCGHRRSTAAARIIGGIVRESLDSTIHD